MDFGDLGGVFDDGGLLGDGHHWGGGGDHHHWGDDTWFAYAGAGDGGSAAGKLAQPRTYKEIYAALRNRLKHEAIDAKLPDPKAAESPAWLSAFPEGEITPLSGHLAKATLDEARAKLGETTAALPGDEFALLSGLSSHQKRLDTAAHANLIDKVSHAIDGQNPAQAGEKLANTGKKLEEAAERMRRSARTSGWVVAGVAVVALGAILWTAHRHKQKLAAQKSFAQHVNENRAAQAMSVSPRGAGI